MKRMDELIFFRAPSSESTLFISQLEGSVEEEQLYDAFSKYGLIHNLKINRNFAVKDGKTEQSTSKTSFLLFFPSFFFSISLFPPSSYSNVGIVIFLLHFKCFECSLRK